MSGEAGRSKQSCWILFLVKWIIIIIITSQNIWFWHSLTQEFLSAKSELSSNFLTLAQLPSSLDWPLHQVEHIPLEVGISVKFWQAILRDSYCYTGHHFCVFYGLVSFLEKPYLWNQHSICFCIACICFCYFSPCGYYLGESTGHYGIYQDAAVRHSCLGVDRMNLQ